MTGKDMHDNDCEHIVALLPWLLNGTLAEGERETVRAHLAVCAECRQELAATVRAEELFATHPASEDLVDYALGGELAGLSRADFEAHLAHCAACQEDLATVQSGTAPGLVTALPVARAEARPAWRGWQPLALAASLAAVALTTGLLMQTRGPDSPQANIAVLELLPESQALRGPAPAVERPDLADGVLVVLVTDLVEPFDAYRARLLTADGEVAWEVGDLEPNADGDFSFLLPSATPTPAQRIIELEGLRGGDWHSLERYHSGF